MVVAESHIQCQNEVLPTLNTLNPGNKTMYLCPWNKKPRLLHYQFVKNLHTCAIVPEKSLYLLNGSWKRRPRHDPALSKLVVEIGPDPGFLNDRLFLKVSGNEIETLSKSPWMGSPSQDTQHDVTSEYYYSPLDGMLVHHSIPNMMRLVVFTTPPWMGW